MIHSGCLEPFLRRTATEGDWFHEELWTAGLPPSLAEGAEFIIPFEFAINFVGRSARRLKAEEFGLQVGATTSIRSLPKLGSVVETSTTLLEAITAIVEALSSITNVRRVWLDIGLKTARLNHSSPVIRFAGEEHAEQFALMLLINLVREVAGEDWSPDHVTVNQSAFDLVGRRPEALNNTLVSAGKFTSFAFDAALLWRRLPLKQHSSNILPEDNSPEMPKDFIGAICATLEANLRSGRVGLESLTQAMGVGPRTLQRKLAERGMTYEQLLGEARLRVARELLAAPDIRIAEIALELGYQDPANFTRAFKRWTGLAPFEYRNRMLLGDDPAD